jgi:peptidoglycan/LPS O-acetylase OafA/YrhL
VSLRTGEIRALTGLRIVAAMWVVLFHFRPLIWEASPRLEDDLAPLLNSGAQGVDLFFILSGFVLTWNYLERMGPSWSTRATVEEPARRWMRRMVDFRDVKTIRAELPADPTGKLASIGGARDGRQPRPARAG